MSVTAIICAKDEEGTIAAVVRGVIPFVDEIYVIDGHSLDDTAAVAREAGAQVVPDRGHGKGDAYKLGLEIAQGEFVVFIDADGSHRPQDIPELLAPLTDGTHDLVIASRITGGSEESRGSFSNLVRSLGGELLSTIVTRRYGVRLTDVLNGFRAGRTDFLRSLPLKADDFDIEHEMVMLALKRGGRVCEVPSQELARQAGASKLPTYRKAHKFVWRLLRNL